jgi:hypothetical protein
MKKVYLIILFSLSFGFSFSSQAKDEQDIYRFGVSAGWVNYLEPGYVSFYGLMYGVDGLVQLNYHSGFDLRIDASLLYGNIQYDGSVKDIQTGAIAPLKAGSYDYVFVTRIKPEFQLGQNGGSDYFFNFGLGFRYLNDRVNSTSGYQREVSYVFLPIGLRTESRIGDAFIIGADLEYDFFLVGKVNSHLSDTNPSNPDVTNTQSSGYGIRAQTEFRFLAGSNWYGIRPYFQWWNIGASNAAPYTQGLVLVEPQNSSSLFGIIFDVGF